MKASELVKRLQEIIEDHGDCDVYDTFYDILCIAEYEHSEQAVTLHFLDTSDFA